jgi:hypothetical protein
MGKVGVVFIEDFLGHAISAAEITSIGDRDA